MGRTVREVRDLADLAMLGVRTPCLYNVDLSDCWIAYLAALRVGLFSSDIVVIEKKTGARALRQLVESLMLDVMYELPARKDPREYVITDKNVRGEEPVIARPLKAAKKDNEKKETA